MDAAPVPSPAEKKPRRRAAAVAGVVGVGAVIGGGAWAWQFWATQGPQPAEALPANTLAYVALDLAPTGGQKVAAYDTLRKFPSLKKELKLGSQDDLRRSLVNEVTSESGCDIKTDIEAWAGDRAAMAVVPGKKTPEIVAVVQIKDGDKAKSGLEEIARKCDDFGFALDDQWAVLAETSAIARDVQVGAEKSPLSDDTDYRELTGAAGDPGVLTLYAAPSAGQALLDVVEEDPFLGYFVLAPLSTLDPISSLISLSTFLSYDLDEHSYDSDSGVEISEDDMPELPDMTPEEKRLMERFENYEDLSPAEQKKLDDEAEAFYTKQMEEEFGEDFPYEDEMADEEDYELEGPELSADLKQKLQDFSGIGGVARFDDGTLELEVVADPLIGGYASRYDGTDALTSIAALPADSALAFGGGFADGWAKDALTDGTNIFGEDSSETEMLADFKKATGLTPADLEALGGDSVAFVARTGFEKQLDSDDFDSFPLAARITGDAGKIESALDKVRATLGTEDAKALESRRTADGVVVGPSPSYLDDLVDPKQTLGDSDRFRRAVPEADKALAIVFADADAGSWLTFITDSDVDDKDAQAFDAGGLTVTEDGNQHRILLRVTFD